MELNDFWVPIEIQIGGLKMKKRYTYLTLFLMGEILNEKFENEVTLLEFQSGEVKKKKEKSLDFCIWFQ